MSDALHIALIAVGALVAVWWVLLAVLLAVRPRGARLGEALRLLPDTLRLIAALTLDDEVPRGVHWRLMALAAYLAMPLDLVPDFVPVLGQADDVIVVCLVLRSVVRRAGPEAVARNWRGTRVGLETLWRAARLPGRCPGPETRLASPSGQAHVAHSEEPTRTTRSGNDGSS